MQIFKLSKPGEGLSV